jgi:tetratricopeptide (TPR) repeat protein
MRTATFGYLAISLVIASAARADDEGATGWENTTAVITTRTPVKLTTAKGEHVDVVFPIVRTIGAAGDQILVVTFTGHAGSIDKSKLVPLVGAAELFAERIKNNRDDADSYYRRALVREATGDHRGALLDFAAAIRIDSKEADYFVGRAFSHLAASDLGKAADDVIEALRLDPKIAIARYVGGRIHLNDGQAQEAIADFTEAIRLLPGFAPAYVHRARGRRSIGDKRGALDDYAEAIKLNPKDDEAFLFRGVAYYVEKKACREAIDDFTSAVALNAKNLIALNNLAWIKATCRNDKVRDGAKAVELAKTACELEGWKRPEFLGTYAAALAEVGQFDEAVKWQEKALALFPEAARKQFAPNLELYRSRKPKRD